MDQIGAVTPLFFGGLSEQMSECVTIQKNRIEPHTVHRITLTGIFFINISISHIIPLWYIWFFYWALFLQKKKRKKCFPRRVEGTLLVWSITLVTAILSPIQDRKKRTKPPPSSKWKSLPYTAEVYIYSEKRSGAAINLDESTHAVYTIASTLCSKSQ